MIFAAELLATVVGLFSVYLLSTGNGRGWGIGMIMMILAGGVYFHKGLFGSAYLQIFFLLTQIEGWRRWKQGRKEDLRVSAKSFSLRFGTSTIIGFLAAWWLTFRVLSAHGGAALLQDSFCTAGSIFAQLLMVA